MYSKLEKKVKIFTFKSKRNYLLEAGMIHHRIQARTQDFQRRGSYFGKSGLKPKGGGVLLGKKWTFFYYTPAMELLAQWGGGRSPSGYRPGISVR